ncbi:helix-turn-helix domain-containing protein [Herbaspirillum sp. WKF16]|jgi:DNA-binding HxlR family transcriptional regulator|uniref:winged helix-turn-helix transcriptional regulator n=1 Tax=Herbaspirillum sp. WKF16 TaxID=3028312 RepID=UPI0023A93650|nr:helix-turn-helix domain-containing protein [Herbaspirillum sp. WKF16]WDZ96275.1 helix-turn-helix domain-containing protein [Herbaspirillum sp. WKF16]
MPANKKPAADQRARYAEHCPVGRSLDLVGDRWALLIVRDAFDGLRRFSEFRDSLGVARNILSDRLRKLVDAGILDSVPASDGSAYQEYILTRKGEALLPVVVGLRQWGEQHLFAAGESHSTLVEKKNGRALPRMQPLGSDGKPVAAHQVEVKKAPSPRARPAKAAA